MSISRKQLNELDVVFDEFIRAMDAYILRNHQENSVLPSKYNLAPTLKRKDGSSFLIGDEAHDKLVDFSIKFRKLYRYEKLINLKDLLNILKELISEIIFKDLEVINSSIESFLEKLDERIVQGLKSYSVIVPLVASEREEFSQELRVGDVRIYSRDILIGNTTTKIREKTDDKYAIYEEIADNYEKFKWFIEVPVSGVYSLKVATSIALEIATLILNMFHLRIGLSHSDRMDVGFGLFPDRNQYVLLNEEGKDPSYIRSKGARGNLGFKEGFLGIFTQGDWVEVLEIIANAAKLKLDLTNSYPFNNRLIECIHWYGEGVREESTTVAVVKYVTALERLLTFNEQEAIKRRICNRATALLVNNGYAYVSEADIAKKKLATIYELRSGIVHGTISPDSNEIGVPVRDIELICRRIIISFALAVSSGLDSTDKEFKLKKWLMELVDFYKIDFA